MLAFASALVRAWTRLYTRGLDPDVRDARRAEIDSDLWEYADDVATEGTGQLGAGMHVCARLLLGLPDDLIWRREHAPALAAVATFGLAGRASSPIVVRRISGFGASAVCHLLAVMIAMWLAPRFVAVSRSVRNAVSSPGPRIVYLPSIDAAALAKLANPDVPAVDVPDDLGIVVEPDASTIALPDFTFDFRKVVNRAGSLFPFVTGSIALELIAATAEGPAEPSRLINPFSRGIAGTTPAPSLQMNSAALQAVVDKTWSRRERWDAFKPIVTFADVYDSNAGQLPALVQSYVEQNGLQPYVQTGDRDPRLWTQLGVAADHADFIQFISRYISTHPSSRTTTELLFLLDTLAQGNFDTLTALLDVVPDADLRWTFDANRTAFGAVIAMQKHYREELERRDLSTRAKLKAYYDEARLSILSNVVRTTPAGYRASDARYLMGAIYWKQGRVADALGAWNAMTTQSESRHAQAVAEILDAVRGGDVNRLDARAINRILDNERGRWISFSHDRLRQFGYRFNTF